MDYKTKLLNLRKNDILENYKLLPDTVKSYTMPEFINAKRKDTIKIGLGYVGFVGPLHDLVLAGKFNFDEKLPLEGIVKRLEETSFE